MRRFRIRFRVRLLLFAATAFKPTKTKCTSRPSWAPHTLFPMLILSVCIGRAAHRFWRRLHCVYAMRLCLISPRITRTPCISRSGRYWISIRFFCGSIASTYCMLRAIMCRRTAGSSIVTCSVFRSILCSIFCTSRIYVSAIPCASFAWVLHERAPRVRFSSHS